MADLMDSKKIEECEECEETYKMWADRDAGESEIAYYRSIDKCAAEGSDKFIENSMPAHATYLMLKMFQKAVGEVRLFSGSLCMSRIKEDIPSDEKVYASNKLIKEAISFLQDRSGVLEIVLEKDIDGSLGTHPLITAISAIKNQIKGRVVVRKLSSGNAIPDKKHFMVMDNKAYRVEYDHDNTKAVANFGDTERASQWAQYFDKVLVKNSSVIFTAQSA